MKEIFRLALRNLSEHKSKTIIISLFLVFGMAIVVLGNSFLESINRGLEKDFRQNYTGDLVISIQPEKEIVMILAKNDLIDGILKGLYNAVGTATSAQGIAFALPVDEVVGIEEKVVEKKDQ